MTNREPFADLPRRERQILEIIYRLGQASAVEVEEHLPDAPTNATVRTLLKKIETRGLLTHVRKGKRFVYSPVIPEEKARSRALDHLLETFFMGSASRAVVALLDRSKSDLSEDEREEIARLIDDERRRGR